MNRKFGLFNRFLSRHLRHRFSVSPVFTVTFLGTTETLVTSPAGVFDRLRFRYARIFSIFIMQHTLCISDEFHTMSLPEYFCLKIKIPKRKNALFLRSIMLALLMLYYKTRS